MGCPSKRRPQLYQCEHFHIIKSAPGTLSQCHARSEALLSTQLLEDGCLQPRVCGKVLVGQRQLRDGRRGVDSHPAGTHTRKTSAVRMKLVHVARYFGATVRWATWSGHSHPAGTHTREKTAVRIKLVHAARYFVARGNCEAGTRMREYTSRRAQACAPPSLKMMRAEQKERSIHCSAQA